MDEYDFDDTYLDDSEASGFKEGFGIGLLCAAALNIVYWGFVIYAKSQFI